MSELPHDSLLVNAEAFEANCCRIFFLTFVKGWVLMWRLFIGAESLVFAFAGERETRASLHALSWAHKHSMKSGKECQGHHSCPVLKTQQKAGV